VIYCCYLTVAESAGTLQLILNLKRQFYPFFGFAFDITISRLQSFADMVRSGLMR